MTVGRREDSGRNPDVPGLIFGLREASVRLLCVDENYLIVGHRMHPVVAKWMFLAMVLIA